jgi:hypothetical protein
MHANVYTALDEKMAFTPKTVTAIFSRSSERDYVSEKLPTGQREGGRLDLRGHMLSRVLIDAASSFGSGESTVWSLRG